MTRLIEDIQRNLDQYLTDEGCKKISPDEVRKIKVKEVQERRKQNFQGYTKLKEQLPATLCKTSNAKLLKK
ncbi:11878_t:CDS:2, partial [Gigaspora margarita]